MQYYPIKPTESIDLSWKDYVEVFDGADNVSSGNLSGVFDAGYEYRLMFHGVSTSLALSNGYNELKISATHQSGYMFYGSTLAYINRSRVYGTVILGGFGGSNSTYSIQNNLYVSDGRVNGYNYSKYVNAGNPVSVLNFSVSANSGSTLTGRCVLQRRRVAA